jgi:glycerate kinase
VTRDRRPRVVLAPDAFKGSYDPVQVADAWAHALADVARVDPRPISDGGEGFLAVLRHYRPDLLEARVRVPDPLGHSIDAAWAWDPGRRAVWIESAAAVGLKLVAPDQRRPLDADSAGLGRLLRTVGALGVRRLVIGLGGSATVDGGLGMARELGFRFEDGRRRPVRRPGDLRRLARIEPPARPLEVAGRIAALADVDHPLLGPNGAAAAFGPQKGATPDEIERLEAGLARLAERWVADLGAPPALASARGSGAAGGLGGGLVAFLGARLTRGSAWGGRLAGLGRSLDRADLVLTGEGRFDRGSLAGKGSGRVIREARRRGLPVAVVCARAESAAPPGTLVVDARDLPSRGPGAEDHPGELSPDDLGRLARHAFERLRKPVS